MPVSQHTNSQHHSIRYSSGSTELSRVGYYDISRPANVRSTGLALQSSTGLSPLSCKSVLVRPIGIRQTVCIWHVSHSFFVEEKGEPNDMFKRYQMAEIFEAQMSIAQKCVQNHHSSYYNAAKSPTHHRENVGKKSPCGIIGYYHSHIHPITNFNPVSGRYPDSLQRKVCRSSIERLTRIQRKETERTQLGS